jgi:hypothetical protein
MGATKIMVMRHAEKPASPPTEPRVPIGRPSE